MEKKWIAVLLIAAVIIIFFFVSQKREIVEITLPHSGEKVQLIEVESSSSYRSWSFLAEKIEPGVEIVYRGEGDPGGARYYLHYADAAIEYNFSDTPFLKEYYCFRGNCGFGVTRNKTVRWEDVNCSSNTNTTLCFLNGTYSNVLNFCAGITRNEGLGCPV